MTFIVIFSYWQLILKQNEIRYNKNWLHHKELIKGGRLKFNMNKTPNYEWGSAKNSIPYSMTNE